MRIQLKTFVKVNKEEVKRRFSSDLFLALSPPFPRVKLTRFDGCGQGDVVRIELNFFLFKQVWESEIIEESDSVDSWSFVDEGIRLPFFLKNWRHHHIVQGNSGNGSEVIDDIVFSTGTKLTDMLMYPALYLQFLYRKPVYRRFFK